MQIMTGKSGEPFELPMHLILGRILFIALALFGLVIGLFDSWYAWLAVLGMLTAAFAVLNHLRKMR
jgi:hypothetical protein